MLFFFFFLTTENQNQCASRSASQDLIPMAIDGICNFIKLINNIEF